MSWCAWVQPLHVYTLSTRQHKPPRWLSLVCSPGIKTVFASKGGLNLEFVTETPPPTPPLPPDRHTDTTWGSGHFHYNRQQSRSGFSLQSPGSCRSTALSRSGPVIRNRADEGTSRVWPSHPFVLSEVNSCILIGQRMSCFSFFFFFYHMLPGSVL